MFRGHLKHSSILCVAVLMCSCLLYNEIQEISIALNHVMDGVPLDSGEVDYSATFIKPETKQILFEPKLFFSREH